MESCAACGFVWDDVTADDVGPRLIAAAESIATCLRESPAAAEQRPEPAVWSMLEYAGHVRDVIINLRDRIVLGVVEDNPVPKAMFGDARIELGLYATDTPDVAAAELTFVAALFTRTVTALTPDQLARPIFYGWPVPATRTLLWVAAQTVHEAEHHLADVVAVHDRVTAG